MDAERDNFRVAIAWALDMGEASLALRLTSALWEFWWVRGYLAEGRGWLAGAIARGRERLARATGAWAARRREPRDPPG